MSDHASENREWDSADDAERPNHDPDGSIEAYETDDESVVLFDAENPLAWVEATRALTLREHA